MAKRLGVSTEALKSAMQAAAVDRIDAAVAAGKLTAAQANSLKQRIREGRGPLSGRMLHAGAHGGPFGAAARYLGLTPLALRASAPPGSRSARSPQPPRASRLPASRRRSRRLRRRGLMPRCRAAESPRSRQTGDSTRSRRTCRRSSRAQLPRARSRSGTAADCQSRSFPRTVLHDCQVMRRITSVMPKPMSGSAIGAPSATTIAEATTARLT